MLKNIFYSKTSVFLLILFIVSFFRFLLLPNFLRHLTNFRLLMLIVTVITLWIFDNAKPRISNPHLKKINLLMICLSICVILNCISCLYYRGQSVFETFCNWSPILLLYLFYPLYSLDLKVKDWEKILFWLFAINVLIHIVLTFLDRPYLLFALDVHAARYEYDHRLRLFSDGILFLGSIFSFNKLLTNKNNKIYFLLYLLSLFAIFLMGFRTVITVILVVCFLLYVKIKGLSIKHAALSIVLLCITFFLFSNNDSIRNRIQEIAQRNQTENFGNEDYIRLRLAYFYYSDYFKSKTEMVLGSGMVLRINDSTERTEYFKAVYPSNYSKEVSLTSERYHFFPVDLGLIGFSWEAGIPAAIVLLLLCFLMLIPSQDDEYNYIRGWGLFNILTSVTVPFYYYHRNLIYTVIVLIIFMKLKGKKAKDLNKIKHISF